MTDTLSISILQENEIEELVRLVNSAYRGESSKKGWTTEAELLDGVRTDKTAIASIITARNSLIKICRSGDESLIGCVYLHIDKSTLNLGMLTVSPTLQGKGIGKVLLKEAENYAKQNDCTAIEMTVIEQRTELLAWYNSKGYLPTGETKAFPDDPAFGIPKQPLRFLVLRKII